MRTVTDNPGPVTDSAHLFIDSETMSLFLVLGSWVAKLFCRAGDFPSKIGSQLIFEDVVASIPVSESVSNQ